tara:strand:- start:4471 stop:4752 length:282 start_codon:yes stop_codon:yes gene_type:complete
MRRDTMILDSIFQESDNSEMNFKRNLYFNKPPREVVEHAQKENIPLGSDTSKFVIDYYLKTNKLKPAKFYEEAGYFKHYYPDFEDNEETEEVD